MALLLPDGAILLVEPFLKHIPHVKCEVTCPRRCFSFVLFENIQFSFVIGRNFHSFVKLITITLENFTRFLCLKDFYLLYYKHSERSIHWTLFWLKFSVRCTNFQSTERCFSSFSVRADQTNLKKVSNV